MLAVNLSQLLDTEILRTQRELADNIVASGQRATGRTIAALRSESAPELSRLLGAAHIGVLEDGSGPARDPNAKPGRAMVEDIRLWLEARGLAINPWALATSILRKGTRLHRGEDPRFSRPTGTLRDVLAASRARLRQDITAETRRSISSELFADFASKTAY